MKLLSFNVQSNDPDMKEKFEAGSHGRLMECKKLSEKEINVILNGVEVQVLCSLVNSIENNSRRDQKGFKKLKNLAESQVC